MAGGVPQIPGHSAVPAGQPEHGPRRLQGHLLGEYVHRLLGRLIGAAFLLPLLWFAARGRISRALTWKLSGIFVLGGLQGAMGWYMVQSGLVDDPRVSQYRLAAHLALAARDLRGRCCGVALDLLYKRRVDAAAGPRGLAFALAGLVFVMAISGSFVAGIRAGLAYNSFPLMNGHLVPPGMFVIDPWYLNFFNNIATVQFDHRLLAWLLAFVVPWFWVRCVDRGIESREARGASAARDSRAADRAGDLDAAARGSAAAGRRAPGGSAARVSPRPYSPRTASAD